MAKSTLRTTDTNHFRTTDRSRRVSGVVRSLGAFVAAAAIVNACGWIDGTDSEFGSTRQAAEAFAPEDLPDIEPWDPNDGVCRSLLVGDSLVEATVQAQERAFSYMGCESIVDGLAARSLSNGWQCLGKGGASPQIVLRPEPEPGNATCRPSGLELLRLWSDFTPAASVTVIALGTNDAGMFTEDTWIRRWMRAAELTSGPLVFVTVGARPGDRWVEEAASYNAALRRWCPFEPRCTLAEWDLTAPAQDPNSYTDHVHLTREVGEMRAVFIAVAARRVAVPAPKGPDRWKAPTISLPPAPSTSLGPTESSGPYDSTQPSIPPTWIPPTMVSTTSNAPVSDPPSDPSSPPAVPPSPVVTTTTLPKSNSG